MEPRQDESKKEPEPRQEGKAKKSRFRIEKLEERIAPRSGGYYLYQHHGWRNHGHYAPPGHEGGRY